MTRKELALAIWYLLDHKCDKKIWLKAMLYGYAGIPAQSKHQLEETYYSMLEEKEEYNERTF